MTRSKAADWTKIMFDTSSLCADAGIVVALRSWGMMVGGRASQLEFDRMFGEKIEAGAELVDALAGGRAKSPEAAARKALAIYGKRVRDNRRRLS